MRNNQVDDFIKAAVSGDMLSVINYLNQGLSPNDKNNHFLSPFIAAAANGQTEVFQLLLESQPDLNQVNKFGGTALIPSSEKGFLSVVEIALTTKIPVNHVNRLGWSALLEAVILGDGGFLYQDIIRALLASSADCFQQDFYQKNSYDYAKELQQTAICELLNERKQEDDFSQIREFLKTGNIIKAINKLLQMKESLKKTFYLGQSFERLKRDKDADYYYRLGAKQDPQFYFYLANSLRRQGDLTAALELLEKGISKTNTYFFRYQKSNFLRDMGRHQEAILEMDQLLLEYPERVDFLFHRANSLEVVGELEEAVASLVVANKYQPSNKLFTEQVKRIKNIKKEK